jgi:hypothetical protein
VIAITWQHVSNAIPGQAMIMSMTEQTHSLEAELEQSKWDLHENLSEIASKLRHSRVGAGPAGMVREQPLVALGFALLCGLLLGYWDVPFKDIGKPVARTMLATAAKQMAVRAIKGQTR